MSKKINSLLNAALKSSLTVFSILGLVMAGMYHSSCQITPQGITIVGDNAASPKITEVNTNDDFIEVLFSKRVQVEKAFAVEENAELTSIENFLDTDEKLSVLWSQNEEGTKLTFNTKEETKIGVHYQMFSCVKDENGNSLSFTIPFFGKNDHPAKVVLSEVNETYSKNDGMTEFVELYVVEKGNLFGLELYSASDKRSFELPAAEVATGEYVIVHLRSPADSNGAVSELDADLSLSTALGAVRGARDIWMEGDQSALSSTAEIIILSDKSHSKMIDCLMYCKQEYAEQNSDWKSESLKEVSALCVESGLWKGEGKPSDSVYSTKRKSISYISRTNIADIKQDSELENSCSVWEGITKSRLTPGKPNECM